MATLYGKVEFTMMFIREANRLFKSEEETESLVEFTASPQPFCGGGIEN